MAREPIPTWYFSLVVVRDGDRFLVVREVKHGELWYLPAGRAEVGETLEEGGIEPVLEGVLKVQHTPTPKSARVRVLFLARPADGRPPKQHADEHSLEARWVTLEEAAKLPMRGPEVMAVFRWVAG